MVLLLAAILAFVWLVFRETSVCTRSAAYLARAIASLAEAVRPGRLRRLYLTNFVLYLAIFGFFRVYPMYLVNHFHMDVARESLFLAWVAVPIVAANLGIVSWLARRLSPPQTAARLAPVLALAMVAIVIPHRQGALWITLG